MGTVNRRGPGCCCSSSPALCTTCPAGSTIYFWYNYITGTPSSPVTTLIGPVAVDYDPALDAWHTHYPAAFQRPATSNGCATGGVDSFYYGEISVALKPAASDCNVWVHAAEQGCSVNTFCQYTAKEATDVADWIATASGLPLDLANTTPLTSGCTPGGHSYWAHSYSSKSILANCSSNLIYKDTGNFWAWTRSSSPGPGI